jgi:hypothetical protein
MDYGKVKIVNIIGEKLNRYYLADQNSHCVVFFEKLSNSV